MRCARDGLRDGCRLAKPRHSAGWKGIRLVGRDDAVGVLIVPVLVVVLVLDRGDVAEIGSRDAALVCKSLRAGLGPLRHCVVPVRRACVMRQTLQVGCLNPA